MVSVQSVRDPKYIVLFLPGIRTDEHFHEAKLRTFLPDGEIRILRPYVIDYYSDLSCKFWF